MADHQLSSNPKIQKRSHLIFANTKSIDSNHAAMWELLET